MATYSTIPDLSAAWSNNAAPLSQTREQTRDDFRRILNLPVTVQALGDLTRNMNAAADISAVSVVTLETSLAEYKTLETQRTTLQSQATWDGDAPLKKADVVEYDTSLLAGRDVITTQTQGINARMGQIEMEIRVSLGYVGGNETARMYRS
jgi:hypothetical protein|tara:strand:- start:1584 stop:2036 length:453 start_codon:yes stop_codon:yes gene_type:complete